MSVTDVVTALKLVRDVVMIVENKVKSMRMTVGAAKEMCAEVIGSLKWLDDLIVNPATVEIAVELQKARNLGGSTPISYIGKLLKYAERAKEIAERFQFVEGNMTHWYSVVTASSKNQKKFLLTFTKSGSTDEQAMEKCYRSYKDTMSGIMDLLIVKSASASMEGLVFQKEMLAMMKKEQEERKEAQGRNIQSYMTQMMAQTESNAKILGPSLVTAISLGNEDTVDCILADIYTSAYVLNFAASDHNNDTPLTMAVRLGYKGIVHKLLQKADSGGLDKNKPDIKGNSPLLIAIQAVSTVAKNETVQGNSKLSDREEIVKSLIAKGVDLSATNLQQEQALFRAIEKNLHEIVMMILNAGRSQPEFVLKTINASNPIGETPLLKAITVASAKEGKEKGSSLKIIETLVNFEGINVNMETKGTRAVFLAILKQRQDIIQLLLSSSKLDLTLKSLVNVPGRDKKLSCPALIYAVYVAPNIAEYLCKQKFDKFVLDDEGESALIVAATLGLGNICAALVNDESATPAKVNHGCYKNKTALSHACKFGQTECVRVLLRNKSIDPNKVSDSDRTPLLFAIEHGQKESAFLLIDDPRVDVNCHEPSGWSPLTYAVSQGYRETVKKLLEHPKIDINQPTYYARYSALSLAKDPEILSMLRYHDAVKNLAAGSIALSYHQWLEDSVGHAVPIAN